MNVRANIEATASTMTVAERKLANTLLSDYPFAGLDSIQSFAGKSRVSAPSVSRFVNKLGCKGYLDFQRCLIKELREEQCSPAELQLTVKDTCGDLPHTIGGFAERSINLLGQLPGSVSENQFSSVCELLSDEGRALYVLGGDMSDPVLILLSNHLRRIRRQVFHLSKDSSTWPDSIMKMRSRDVFVTMDLRRYQPSLYQLSSQIVTQSNASVLLFTDKWLSPIADHAAEVVSLPIENGSAWDTSLAAVTFCEAIIERVAGNNPEKTHRRLKDWDALRSAMEVAS